MTWTTSRPGLDLGLVKVDLLDGSKTAFIYTMALKPSAAFKMGLTALNTSDRFEVG